MTIATNQPIQQKPLRFDEFLARYSGDNRYELIDGEVFDLEPTSLHEEVAAFITTKVCVEIDRTGLPCFVLQRGLLRPSNMDMTAFRPDVAVVDRDELTKELFWSDQSILTLGGSIKFVAKLLVATGKMIMLERLKIMQLWASPNIGLQTTQVMVVLDTLGSLSDPPSLSVH